MKIRTEKLIIELEENEIDDFWNIVEFALDLQAERDKRNESCMSSAELKLAKELAEITHKFICWGVVMKYIRTKDMVIEINPTLTDEQIDISLGKNTPRAEKQAIEDFKKIALKGELELSWNT